MSWRSFLGFVYNLFANLPVLHACTSARLHACDAISSI